MTSAKKAEKGSSGKRGGGKARGANGGEAAADNRTRVAIITVIVCVLVLAGVLALIFGLRSCSDGKPVKNNFQIAVPPTGGYNPGGDLKPGDPYEKVTVGKETFDQTEPDDYDYDAERATNTAVGYYGKVIGTVERVVPKKTRDEGLGVYPKFGYTLSTVIGNGDEQVRGRKELIEESNYLTATGTLNAGGGNYKFMDKDGFLYNGTTAEPQQSLDKAGKPRRLYKHSASAGLYMGDVSPDEPGIIKRVTMRPRGYDGYGVTGVYAPAGEVIKIQLGEADMDATGGIVIHIGQALYNGKANNIWVEKGQMPRIPHLLNTMTVDKNTSVFDVDTKTYTAYVGSFIGGPLYIRNEGVTFTATISGGVAYSHFILGYTTEEEFNKNASSTAPYFDLEVWHNGVLHSGAKTGASGLNYDDIYNAAVLWDKIASVTTTGSNQGIVFLYDPFVAAGAAVAFPGQRSVNCPQDWMRASLDSDGLVTTGSWGNLHEYHHNFQGYGVGNGGEVTNNGMTLVSYALFTKISALRGLGDCGSQGLGGWNSYTSATWALGEVLKISGGQNPSNGKQGLALYATLLHNLGADNYIQAKVRQQSLRYGESYEGYLKAWQDVTHNDMTYFFKDLLCGIDDAKAAELKNADYPVFVPVSSVFQTGRSYYFDGQKKYIKTMRPYVVPYGKATEIDLGKYTAAGGRYQSGSVVIPDGFSYEIKRVSAPKCGTFEPVEGTKYRYTPDGYNRSGEITVTLGITKDDGAFTVDDVDLVLEFEPSQEKTKTEIKRTTYTYGGSVKYADAQEAYENGFAGYTEKSEIVHTNPVQSCNTDIWYYPDTQENRDEYADAPEHFFAPTDAVAVLEGKLHIESEGKYRIYLRGRTNCAFYYSTDGGATYLAGGAIKSGTGSGFRFDDENTYVDVQMPSNSWIFFKSVLIANSGADRFSSFMGLGLARWTSSEAPAGGAPYVNAFRTDYEYVESTFETEYFYTREYTYSYTDELGSGDVFNAEGTQASPDGALFAFDGNWTAKSAQSTFGHLYVGKKDAKLTFTFEGSRLLILSGKAYGGAFKVEIDGLLLPTEQLKSDGGDTYVSYISPELGGGEHSVTVTCVGDASIDSIVACK